MKCGLIRISLILLLPLTLGAAAVPEVEINLKTTAVLPAGETRLGQIAAVSSPEPELADSLAMLPVGATPWPGSTRSVSRNQIALQLNRSGIDLGLVRWRGARTCTVSVRSVKITSDAIVNCAREYLESIPLLRERNAQIEVERMPRPKIVALGKDDTKPVLDASVTSLDRPWGRIRVHVKIRNGAKVVATVPVMLGVTVRQKVLFTARPIRRGEMIEKAALKEREIVLGATSASESYVTELKQALGKKAVRGLSDGVPLTVSMLADPLAVRRGDGVSMVLTSRHVEISTKGIAQSDGYVGDSVAVEIGATGKRIIGKVTEAGTVQVRF